MPSAPEGLNKHTFVVPVWDRVGGIRYDDARKGRPGRARANTLLAANAAPSLSELAIASGPQSAAPTSFNVNGWLFVINLWLMTATTYIGCLALTGLGKELWRKRADGFRHPANIARAIGMLGLFCLFLLCCGEALTLWAWNPNDIATAAWARETKR